MYPVADLKQIRLEMEQRSTVPLPPICVDPVRILHALDSLLLTAIKLASVQAPAEASIGVATDGGSPTLPAFDSLNQQRSYIDVFNKGRGPFEFNLFKFGSHGFDSARGRKYALQLRSDSALSPASEAKES